MLAVIVVLVDGSSEADTSIVVWRHIVIGGVGFSCYNGAKWWWQSQTKIKQEAIKSRELARGGWHGSHSFAMHRIASHAGYSISIYGQSAKH